MHEPSHTDASLPAAHTVPTHLATADTVLSLGYLSLSSRQLLLLLLGGSVTASLWTRTSMLSTLVPPAGAALHLALVICCAAITLALTFGQAQGRSLDVWLIVILSYLARPRLYLWCRMADAPAGWRAREEQG
jgi:hypothetical protein